ncbi:oxygen-insensitive NADPH nitroreductase [Paenibacillus favisporus]|uniref:oxygen-insensitive NADPH nitroreductase n=1 Tax=Paenibacillus favisporus TaxID=221028 RepID=UPI002DBAE123|nr:oxygen-insensitive NADPH nitroreductase [Paenibacillus favisporus]MEC0176799.1 oxygen-insensitive NADPH nitroreductase [Paenibacillus favisporus]
MNKTIETILNHVSVRTFTDQALTENQVKQLVIAAQAASTASFQQAYSIIGVTDPELKLKIAYFAGNQPFIAEGGHFFVFCADVNRHKQMAKDLDMDITETIEGIDAALVGAIDASLAAQNMVIAAESMGLGVCYIGGVRDGIIKISELLDIPEFVFPVFGLVVGYPKKRNELKPRIPFEGIYHINRYDINKKDIVKKYDETTKLYYEEIRSQSRTWSETAIGSFKSLPRSFMKDYLNGKGWAKR